MNALGYDYLSADRVSSVRALIQRALEKEVEEVIEKEIDALKKRVETSVRGSVGHIAARVLERFQMEMRGNSRLVIEVNFDNTKT